MPSLSAYFTNTSVTDRGIPISQFTSYQYNTGGSQWYVSYINTTLSAAYGTGENTYGQLGLGDQDFRNTFTQLTGNWSQVICGGQHTFALSAGTNRWFSTGYNNGFGTDGGQLALGDSVDRNTFTPLTGNWSSIACGHTYTMAFSSGTNKLFAAGTNFWGQLGLGDNINKTSFTPLTGSWSQIECGGVHTMALSTGTNRLFATGYNYSGQLGFGDYTHRNTFTQLTGNWSQVICGGDHTFALSAGTNILFSTGDNTYGQLGFGDYTLRNTFTQLTGNWSQVICGGYHTFALSAGTNRWFGTGNNISGQLGLGDQDMRNTFTQLTGNWSQIVGGINYTMALSTGTNRWFGTGDNSNGQLGLGDQDMRNTFTQLTSGWGQISCGNFYTMAITKPSLLPISFTSPIVIDNIPNEPTNYKLRPVTNTNQIGSEFSFSYSPTLRFFGVGSNAGNLDLPNSLGIYTSFTQTTGSWEGIIPGSQVAWASANGKWYRAGLASYGLDSSANLNTMTELATGQFIKIKCSESNTLAISSNNRLFACGAGSTDGQSLGLQRRTVEGNVTFFTEVKLASARDGAGTIYNDFKVEDISCGAFHNFALSAGTKTWFSCGDNANGQLGLGIAGGVTTSRYANIFTQLTGNWDKIVAGRGQTFMLSANTNKWYICGSGIYGELGMGTGQVAFPTPLTGTWDKIVGCDSFSYALSNRKLFSCGLNSFGNLGFGDFVNRSTFTQLTGDWDDVVCFQRSSTVWARSGFDWYVVGEGTNYVNSFGSTLTTFTKVTGYWNQIYPCRFSSIASMYV